MVESLQTNLWLCVHPCGGSFYYKNMMFLTNSLFVFKLVEWCAPWHQLYLKLCQLPVVVVLIDAFFHFRKEIVYFWFGFVFQFVGDISYLCSKPTKQNKLQGILQFISGFLLLQWHKETFAWSGFYSLAEMSPGCQVGEIQITIVIVS